MIESRDLSELFADRSQSDNWRHGETSGSDVMLSVA